jgi:hypothetical protein
MASTNEALASGTAIRGISRTFRVSEDTRSRHNAQVSVSIVKAVERRDERRGDNLLTRLDKLDEEAWQLFQTMKQEGDHRGAIVGAREYRGCIETRASLLAQAMKLRAANGGAINRSRGPRH